jgi:hypothetical protein
MYVIYSCMEEMPMEPPETDEIKEQYLLKIPVTDGHLKDPEELRKYAVKLLEKQLGDDVELKAVKVKKPHLLSRGISKLFGRVPQATLYCTVKF